MSIKIDDYCERTSPDFFAEPLNAFSNISFLIAAWAAYSILKKSNTYSIGNIVLVFLIFLVGVGSFLFHTFATKWAEILDILPIFCFQICLVWLYAKDIAKFGGGTTFLGVVTFLAANYIALQFPAFLNGSLMYAPAILVLFVLGIFHLLTQKTERWILIYATLVFCVSLLFRTADMVVCQMFPIGTHFIWHILNGLILYLSARSVITATNK